MLLWVTERVWIKKNVAACVTFRIFFHVDFVYYAIDKCVVCSTLLRVIVEFFLVFLTVICGVTLVLDVVYTHCD